MTNWGWHAVMCEPWRNLTRISVTNAAVAMNAITILATASYGAVGDSGA